MKTLMILATILGILSVYFVINTEKSVVIKGNEVTPAGTDIPSLILNKAKEIKSQIGDDNPKNFSGQMADIFEPVITAEGIGAKSDEIGNEVKNIISETFNKIENSIKELIGNKISETLCPQK